jgi:acetyl/propionyl-CoA carboxylase alpha subunit
VKLVASVGGRELQVEVRGEAPPYSVTLDGRELEVDLRPTSSGFVSLTVEGASHEIGLLPRDGGWSVLAGGRALDVRLEDAGAAGAAAPRAAAGGASRVTAPMPGRLVKVLVEAGQDVAEGQGLVVMEAMKMENELRAPRAGRVKELHARERQAVESGALLVVLE